MNLINELKVNVEDLRSSVANLYQNNEESFRLNHCDKYFNIIDEACENTMSIEDDLSKDYVEFLIDSVKGLEKPLTEIYCLLTNLEEDINKFFERSDFIEVINHRNLAVKNLKHILLTLN